MLDLIKKDLSKFPDEDLRITRKWLLRSWCKPWLWRLTIPAYIAIGLELEFRKAMEDAFDF